LYPNLDNNFINSILSKKFDDIYLIKYIPYESSKKLTKEFQDIQIAINNNYTLLFKYNDKKRELKPYKLVNNNGIWYLVGDDNSKLKTFTINKIKNMQLTNEEFTINNEFKTIIEQNQATWFSQDKIDVILQIDISVALYFKRRDLLPNQKILEENDKYLLLSTTVSYDDEILRVVRSWIPHIKIIKPLYLNDKLYKELKEFIKLK
jgi:predicted DNA-binding transcriptional regulator YafY